MTQQRQLQQDPPERDGGDTKYIILKAETGVDVFHAIGAVTARNDRKAIEQQVHDLSRGSDGDLTGDYVAVPFRSWNIRKVKVVNDPKVVVSQ